MEFDARFDEAADRAGLQMNEVAKFFLFFENSGLSGKQIDVTRFADPWHCGWPPKKPKMPTSPTGPMTMRIMRMTRTMSIGLRGTTSTMTKMMRAGGAAMTPTMKMASGSKTSNATPTTTSRTTWMATTGAGLNTMVSQRQTHKHLLEPMRTPPMASRPTRSSMVARAKARARMMDALSASRC